jgi:hypothetical protein
LVLENVAPIIAPDTDQMVQHLQMLFGRALSGKVEITAIHTDKTAKRGPRTQFFDVDALDDAAAFAAQVNAEPGWNAYVGASLRIEDVFPGKAADDDDFLKTYVVWADADDGEQLASARETYRALGITPPVAIVTGRTPSKRAQLWWPLDNPIEDIATLRATLRGIAATLKTDPKVCTGKQLMRLAGGVNWPKKEDRILERTETVTVAKAAREFSLDQIQRAFPPMQRAEFSAAVPDVEIAHAGALGLEEKVMDGREGYAFNLVTAHLHEFIGTTGSEPTVDELYRSVAPVFLAKADQVRAGRGPDFLKQKCADRLRAYHNGQIPFMRGLEEAVQTWATREQRSDNLRAYRGAEGYAATEEGEDADPEPLWNLRAWGASVYSGKAPEIEWLCEGTIPLGIPVLFASMGGLGKSFIAIDLGLAIAVEVVAGLGSRPILGGEVVQTGTAVILSAEDSKDSIHRRLERIDPDGRRHQAPERLIIVPLPDAGGPKPLIASDGKSLSMTPAFYALKAELMAIPDLKVVVIDPLQAFVLADVNADPAAGQFMWSAFASLCAATGATLIVPHHMRKDGAASIKNADQAREAIRGSTALVDGARLAYALWKADADDGREMCARLDVEFAPERIAFGAVVKANDQANRAVQTYVRQESGLLTDQTSKAIDVKPVQGVSMAQAQEIVAEIGRAWDDAEAGRGEGFATSPQSGDRQVWKFIERRAGCSSREAKELAAAWVANGILQLQTYNAKRHKTALRQVGRLG